MIRRYLKIKVVLENVGIGSNKRCLIIMWKDYFVVLALGDMYDDTSS